MHGCCVSGDTVNRANYIWQRTFVFDSSGISSTVAAVLLSVCIRNKAGECAVV